MPTPHTPSPPLPLPLFAVFCPCCGFLPLPLPLPLFAVQGSGLARELAGPNREPPNS
jgi:hypothetical protein